MNNKWKIKEKLEVNIKDLKVEPIVEYLLIQRGIRSKQEAEQFLNPDYEKDLHDPFLFRDMEKFIERIRQAINSNEKVGIFGDHDVDGVSSATLMAEILEKLNLDVDVYIPDKLTEGHGINKKAVDQFTKSGITLMITVDCGMSNVAEIEYAKEKNIETIITDHHIAPDEIPDVVAIINPKVKNCGYPFTGLCGTGVVFKIVQAIYTTFFPDEMEQLKWILDIVGVGTVADCMPLLDENRTLVKYGLIVLSKTQRIGYQEMISVGRMPISGNKIPTAETVAFQIAPRINAAGRMSHAREAYDLLRETNSLKAIERAKDIEQKNVERRKITEKITKEVEKIVESDFAEKPFIFLVAEHYPVGIVGIVAGRIAEKYRKPVGIFTQEKKESRGSFRSVQGIHILEAIKESADLLTQFGGHTQAAGAVISNDNLDDFHLAMQESVGRQAKNFKKEMIEEIDLEISHSEITFELVNEIKKFEPFGEANREPKFLIKNLRLQEIRGVGNGDKHLKLRLVGEDSQIFNAIGFNLGDQKKDLVVGEEVDIVCNIGENEWQGNVSIQFKLIDIGRFEG
ncbi:MAG: single-stranded-DNA-specific exonuclease RecJ [Candidatus Moranbacteria bacterium]|nr:single-stranded-DNA-specific exonuclease RecJ [Candidatus Moranbacteria bacterium]